MILLITGTPGDGKTLKAFDFLLNDHRFKGRPVHYLNVNGLNTDDPRLVNFVELERFEDWLTLPPNSVVLVDEIQDDGILPKRRNGSDVPHHIKELAKHRHRGIDFLWITQNGMNCDQFARTQVDTTVHCRRIGGMKYTTLHEFKGFVNCATSIPAGKALGITRWRFDKSLYGLYHSADAHTHKLRVPKPVIYLALLVLAIGLLVAQQYKHWSTKGAGSPPPASTSQDPFMLGKNGSPTSPGINRPALSPAVQAAAEWAQSVIDFRQSIVPRDPAYPESAEIYDEIRKPKQMPTVAACARMADSCRCYTQQGTAQFVPVATCHQFIAEGRFDPYREPDRPAYRMPANSPAVVPTKEATPGGVAGSSLPGSSPTNYAPGSSRYTDSPRTVAPIKSGGVSSS